MTTINPETLLSNSDLIDVGVQADDVRRRMHGARTTFVRVFEVHVGAPPSARPSGLAAGSFASSAARRPRMSAICSRQGGGGAG